MPLKVTSRAWVNRHGDVGKAHVHKADLRVGTGHRFDGNAVVLLLVDELDAKRHVGTRITKISSVIQHYRAQAYKVTGGTKGADVLTGRPGKYLILCTEYGQTFG